ncbi:MAG: hypothetical protein HDR01_09750 [Lachnospiraceae bacterium]|nr:hypothetical protein [Lachnospiraceae bacterium]
MKILKKYFQEKRNITTAIFMLVNLLLIGALCLFWLLRPDNLMHSDTTAEVILSKLLADENKLITKNWYYSTEIRIVYSQLIMMPLFQIFSNYRLVKTLSIFIFYVLLILAYVYAGKKYELNKPYLLLGMAFLFTPLSNEYLDMMFIGCFYTSQVICTFLVLGMFVKKREGKYRIAGLIALACLSFLLGLSGLRYLASLFLPFVMAFGMELLEREDRKDIKKEELMGFILIALSSFGAFIGFLGNKLYLSKHYSFDTTSEVVFTEISKVPERFMDSIRLMVEFFGYYPVEVVSGRGIVNGLKCLFFLFFIAVIVFLFRNRKKLLNRKQRLLLYYFLACFLINWYMLIFTEVLMQYRYWLPVYVVGVLLLALFFQVYHPSNQLKRPILLLAAAVIALSSLYGELWQDAKYNDCEKRYGYMAFLQEQGYTFGYATFWNSSVTEYLSNGTIEVGNLGGENGVAAPYEWLSKKAYYQPGYHEGKTFLLLARTEEAGMLKGDFTVMEDGVKVYEDEYYAIYEGNGMYLFSEP